MPMLLRFLFVLALTSLAAAQDDPTAAFTHDFGVPGATGSFRLRLAPRGAGVVWLQSADHFVTLEAAQRSVKSGDDYLLLATNGGDHALRLALQPTPAFPLDPALAPWTVVRTAEQITFTLDGGAGLVLEKVLRHDPRQRGFVVELALRNTGAATGSLELGLGGPALVAPTEASLFGNVTGAIVAPVEGDATYCAPKPGEVQRLPVDAANLRFLGSTNRFFGAFVWPLDDVARQALKSAEVDTVPFVADPDSDTPAFGTTRVRYGISLPIPAALGETRAKFGLYLGPKSYRVFATLPEPERFTAILDQDLNAPCCGIDVPGGRPMAKLLLNLLGWFYDLVGNWGLAIMMLTILVRGLLAPLNFHMQKSMRAYSARMAVLKPKLDALKAKFGDDKAGYQQAMMQFQREHKLLPPLGGCLPIFLTMPIYLGLFTALRTAYDVRQQPFVGWMDDLSRPDALGQLDFWPYEFNLLPLLWIGLMLIQMLRQPLPTDPQQRQQMQIMRYMPLIFGVMLYYYAAALLVYMVTSMLWTFVETAITKKILGPVDPNVAAMTPQTF
jgi:YidC/Oxa1 family membrane protein insertase